MGVFDEAAIGDELYYIVGVTNNIPIFKKIKKISPTGISRVSKYEERIRFQTKKYS